VAAVAVAAVVVATVAAAVVVAVAAVAAVAVAGKHRHLSPTLSPRCGERCFNREASSRVFRPSCFALSMKP
jgi:hypothetical protein